MTAPAQPIILGLGANLPGRFGPPRAALGAALQLLIGGDIRLAGRSPWYESAPVPISDQPWYVNGVVTVETGLAPGELLARMLGVEAEMGRQRAERNAARVIDMDLLAYGGMCSGDDAAPPIVPHPRLHQRAFVVLPLQDLLPDWRHPESSQTPAQMAAALPAGQEIRRMDDAPGLFGTEWPGEAA